ncbi:hydroxyacid dehydrogenase [Nonomuraea sp. NEAU-A123]|uniref:hydroxyacid dehydrogenase n=1 Tax=Nonomuraea sp. NEAU-A123 TaxID=2839649 RepID=UPI001BE40E4A|nr:hydroxyacid dehydrogenase [Nonomuraea sp. NEAU-A123]MBT2225696.1 hydroxyacid dehydrogenase [Nonomuraea sp. NEAU-A123]
MLNGLYVMDPNRFDDVYGPEARAAIERHLAIDSPLLTRDRITPDVLAGLEVLVTGWGAPKLDAELLAAAPKLALVLYGAGSIRPMVTPEMWARGVRVTSAATANAEPVAEFALSQILYALKHGWRYVLAARAAAASAPRGPELGAYGATVGLVSLGATGRATARLLAHHELDVQAYDPYADPAQAEELGVRLVGLAELFATSDVVSLHSPLTPETERIVGTGLLESMKPDATLINSARGGLVDEAALVDVLSRRTDLFAVLDVTDPEPPVAGSPLFTMPNIVVTPHVAGSLGRERRRHGQTMAEELARYVAGEPLLYEITESGLAKRA